MSTRIAAGWSLLVRPPFLMCLTVLAAAAVVTGPMARRWEQVFIKEPIHCRKPLDKLRKDALGPYRFIQEQALSAAMISELDTDVYLSWALEDTRERAQSPLRGVHLFITYYTGATNLVPHTPDVCFRGAGYQIKQAGNTTLKIPGLDPGDAEVPVRVLTFVKSDVFHRVEPTVVYTFHCNGEFMAGRTEVRARTTNLRDRHAYFSKVEVSFSGGAGRANPTREDAIEAARKFLGHLLPVLVQEHWPDWQAVRAGDEAA
ncbi:MAG: exosortase-associated EpsI family protein [Phycisphaerales bacterium]|nr:MAG: exosortase-associated EpsI family protein [Phycisphaerales bacterium]